MIVALVWTMKIQSWATIGLFLTSCATPGAQPDDMSASAHKAEARREEAEAKAHEAQFNPTAVTWHTRFESDTDAYDVLPEYYYNPTEGHLARAERHLAHAKAHREAALELESFLREECVGFKVKTRAQCPLLGGVESMIEIDGGVRFVVSAGVDPDGLVAHMKCHFAVGRAAAYEAMSGCPLYLKDLFISRVGDRDVELTSTNAEVVPLLRERMRTHVAGHTHGHP